MTASTVEHFINTSILSRYNISETQAVERLSGGLINDTFSVGDAFVLQKLHKIFGAEVNLDIAALVQMLSEAGVPVPALVPTQDGALWVEVLEGDEAVKGVWRLLTKRPGRTLHQIESPAMAQTAGEAVAKFHTALLGSVHQFHFVRPGAHDTVKHMEALTKALSAHGQHRLYRQVASVAEDILERWNRWTQTETQQNLPKRIVHGDWKVSNLLWDTQGQVSAVLDLDTMAWGTLDIELGDAMRSWCASATESAASVSFVQKTFEAAMQGYWSVAKSWMGQAELLSIPAATERLCLELSARFAADALNETYFGWSFDIAPSRGDHNLLRARNQKMLGAEVFEARDTLKRFLSDLSLS